MTYGFRQESIEGAQRIAAGFVVIRTALADQQFEEVGRFLYALKIVAQKDGIAGEQIVLQNAKYKLAVAVVFWHRIRAAPIHHARNFAVIVLVFCVPVEKIFDLIGQSELQ